VGKLVIHFWDIKFMGWRAESPLGLHEHGALMLSSALNSARADEISQLTVRTFVWLRQTVPAYKKTCRQGGGT